MNRVRTAITTSYKHKLLIKGTALASIGPIALAIALVWLPTTFLQWWGWLFFLSSFAFITIGLLPYRRIEKLERHPDEIICIHDNALAYIHKGKKLFTLPHSAIAKVEYTEKKGSYGIAIHLHSPPPEKVVIHSHTFDMQSYQQRSMSEHHCDLFLPFFTRRSYSVLQPFHNAREVAAGIFTTEPTDSTLGF